MLPATERCGNAAPALAWYVAHTKPRQERVAYENLLRQSYRVYLPLLKVLKWLRRQQEIRFEPLFPRYLFFQPASAGHSIAPVRSTHGVAGIVRFGAFPAELGAETVQGIRFHEHRQHTADLAELSPVQPGKEVVVINGPLAGLEGLVTQVSRERVTVLMRLLGEETKVRLSCRELRVAA
jgi:transcriptional antiterminator RfaH